MFVACALVIEPLFCPTRPPACDAVPFTVLFVTVAFEIVPEKFRPARPPMVALAALPVTVPVAVELVPIEPALTPAMPPPKPLAPTNTLAPEVAVEITPPTSL